MKTLILGGVRSGKSRLAEQLAQNSQQPVVYIATATAGDEEMQMRIEQHKQRRPAHWTLVEEPLHLTETLEKFRNKEHCLIVDCLTLWLTNLLLHRNPDILQEETAALLNWLPNSRDKIIFVANETGLGIVPLGELSRRFGDEAGVLNQRLVQLCDQVIFTIAGLPQVLKGEPLSL